MVETALRDALLDVPLAATIWLVLLVLAVVALAVLVSRSDRRGPTDPGQIRQAARRRAQRAARTRDLRRYADEVAVAADRAAATARRHRAAWLKAQDEAEAAWAAFDVAETAARRLASARPFPAPRTPRTPTEYAERERFLHRAVTSACWRGELSILDLGDAVARRGGWDPRRHPVDQEVVVLRVVRDRALAEHTAAAAGERAAWQTAEVAASAAASLRAEAVAAADRVREAGARGVLENAPAATVRAGAVRAATVRAGAVRAATARVGTAAGGRPGRRRERLRPAAV